MVTLEFLLAVGSGNRGFGLSRPLNRATQWPKRTTMPTKHPPEPSLQCLQFQDFLNPFLHTKFSFIPNFCFQIIFDPFIFSSFLLKIRNDVLEWKLPDFKKELNWFWCALFLIWCKNERKLKIKGRQFFFEKNS